jgi:hypothetical protein
MNTPKHIIDHHCKVIIQSIKDDQDHARLHDVACLNWLSKNASSEDTRHMWSYIGHQLIMAGYLTITDDFTFLIK